MAPATLTSPLLLASSRRPNYCLRNAVQEAALDPNEPVFVLSAIAARHLKISFLFWVKHTALQFEPLIRLYRFATMTLVPCPWIWHQDRVGCEDSRARYSSPIPVQEETLVDKLYSESPSLSADLRGAIYNVANLRYRYRVLLGFHIFTSRQHHQ